MIDLSRRKFFITVGLSSMSLTGLTGILMASELPDLNALTLEQSLESALRKIGTTRCVAAADTLAQPHSVPSPISIHLRSAGIDEAGAARIARALTSLSEAERSRLHSFSLSYNGIGDIGALAMAASLPETLGELGLVGCSIGDDGGEAILNWAKNATGLRMICIEGNAMSQEMRERFTGLRKTSPNMAVYV
ncbi:MAG: hypothetical protein HKP40_09740 [Litoreibacter sp.]|nr:hypothetical protein [Litoreibacter sp.]